jgi:hypothetical protein
VTLRTDIVNQRDECVLRGSAQAKVLRLAQEQEDRPR